MLVIIKFAPIILLWCLINTQCFVHEKSSSVSQFITGKSRNLQKLLRYLSGMVISTFKADTGGHGGHCGWGSSGFCGGCGGYSGLSGLCGVFPTIFVLYINHLPCEALSLTPSILSL